MVDILIGLIVAIISQCNIHHLYAKENLIYTDISYIQYSFVLHNVVTVSTICTHILRFKHVARPLSFFSVGCKNTMGFPGSSADKESTCNAGETWAQFLGWEHPLEKGTAAHSGIFAWRIPWTEKPGGLQSTGLQSLTYLSDFHT